MSSQRPRKPIIIETTSTLTSRYQTTIPSEVRKALGLSKGDTLFYQVDAEGVHLITEEMKARIEAEAGLGMGSGSGEGSQSGRGVPSDREALLGEKPSGITYRPPIREIFLAADSGDETYEVPDRKDEENTSETKQANEAEVEYADTEVQSITTAKGEKGADPDEAVDSDDEADPDEEYATEEWDIHDSDDEDFGGEDPAVLAMLDYLERDIIENPDKLIPLSKGFTLIRNKLVEEEGESLRNTAFEYLLRDDLSDDDIQIFFAELIDSFIDPENPPDWRELIDHDLTDEDIEFLNKPAVIHIREWLENEKRENRAE